MIRMFFVELGTAYLTPFTRFSMRCVVLEISRGVEITPPPPAGSRLAQRVKVVKSAGAEG